MTDLCLRNHQRGHPVNLRLLRRIACYLLDHLLQVREYELGVHLVGEAAISRLNRDFLQHTGLTDVIAFDYQDATAGATPGQADPMLGSSPAAQSGVTNAHDASAPTDDGLHGEIFICVPVAFAQAKAFRTTWAAEIVRYLVHGVLHLRGFDDKHALARKLMKTEENRLLKILSRHFALVELGSGPLERH